MSLYETKKDLTKQARLLPYKYEDADITDLSNNFLAARDINNERNMGIYISAVILRFWYKIDQMYQKVKTCGYDRNDCFDRLYDCIMTAMDYHAWQDPEKHTNAQACINQVLAGRGVPAMVYEANLQKNTRAAVSTDQTLDDESGTTVGDMIADEKAVIDDYAASYIQCLIKKNKIVEAIIADTIAYNDVFKHEKKTVKEEKENGDKYVYSDCSSKFWPFKVVQELNSINERYVNYFAGKYIINIDKLNAAVDALNKANNQKKYKMIDSSLKALKEVMEND
ncbi:MAG: hypothetical protein J6W64_08060 [Bacilli bacterium]|nr:hypothetical protein [Bacilli bacterium]